MPLGQHIVVGYHPCSRNSPKDIAPGFQWVTRRAGKQFAKTQECVHGGAARIRFGGQDSLAVDGISIEHFPPATGIKLNWEIADCSEVAHPEAVSECGEARQVRVLRPCGVEKKYSARSKVGFHYLHELD